MNDMKLRTAGEVVGALGTDGPLDRSPSFASPPQKERRFTCPGCGNTCDCCELGACVNCAFGLALQERAYVEAVKRFRVELDRLSLGDSTLAERLDDIEEAVKAMDIYRPGIARAGER